MQLSKCEALDTLVMFVPLDPNPDMDGPAMERHPYWKTAEIIIGDLPHSLQSLQLGLEIPMNEQDWAEEVLDEVRWRHIARCLDKLPKLNSVKVYATFRWYEDYRVALVDWAQELLCEKLPTLHSKGVLDLTPY